MKALEILNNYKKFDGFIRDITSDSFLNESIAELEALQNRNCRNCKHWELNWCFKLGSSLDIGGCGDYWEQK